MVERGGKARGDGGRSVGLMGFCKTLGMLIWNRWEPVGSFERAEMNGLVF